MELVFLGLILGLIPAFIAIGKGRGFFLWWIYGSLLFIVALPHALLMSAAAPVSAVPIKTCPRCAEEVKLDALICKHCGHDFPAVQVLTVPGPIEIGSRCPSCAAPYFHHIDGGLYRCDSCHTKFQVTG